MVRKVLIVLVLSLLLSTQAFAEQAQEGWGVFIGAGNNFVPFNVIRVRYSDWEFGRLYTDMYGADKMFYFSDHYYTTFGFGLGPFSGFAVQAAIGAKYEMFWGLGFRFEFGAVATSKAYMAEQGALGLTYSF